MNIATIPTAASYRRFTTKLRTVGSEPMFVITEIEPTTRHPLNWTDGSKTREGAWESAQTQIHHALATTADGKETDLGYVFSPEVFERAVYGGYIGYGLSMTDGYYAPIDFEAWVRGFRKTVFANAERLMAADYDLSQAHRDKIFSHNDTPAWVCEGLQTYAYELVKASR